MSLSIGIHPALSNADYHADPAVSKSQLDAIARTPAHWLAQYGPDAVREPPTPAMEFGTAFHMAVLEPDLFRQTYGVLPACDKRTKEGKAIVEAFAASGKLSLTQEQADALRDMTASAYALPIAAAILRDQKAMRETSVVWADDETGLLCKCRPDAWADGIVLDLKTTDDASPDGFARSVAKYRYQVQAAWYRSGLAITTRSDLPRFLFLAVEKRPPYAAALYELDSEALELGAILMRRDLDRLAWSKATGEWPGYGTDVKTLALPRWANSISED